LEFVAASATWLPQSSPTLFHVLPTRRTPRKPVPVDSFHQFSAFSCQSLIFTLVPKPGAIPEKSSVFPEVLLVIVAAFLCALVA